MIDRPVHIAAYEGDVRDIVSVYPGFFRELATRYRGAPISHRTRKGRGEARQNGVSANFYFERAEDGTGFTARRCHPRPLRVGCYRTAGDTTDWTYGTYAIPSFTIELRPSSAEEGGFVVPASQIEPTYRENRAAAFLLIDRLLAPGAARPAGLTRSASKRPRRRG